MGVRVEKTDLPGIGVRHEITTAGGRRVGVITHHDGRRDLLFFDPEDPDSCKASVPLDDDEAGAVAEILGASVLLSQLADLRLDVEGVLTEQLPIPAESPFAGRPLRDTAARRHTGTSIVAVLRQQNVLASPGPEFVFEAGDIVVAVGTRDGLDQLAQLLTDGPA